jgi:uncharacterized delta-60 repeat protein
MKNITNKKRKDMKRKRVMQIGLAVIMATSIIINSGCGGGGGSSGGSSAIPEATGITDTAFGALGVVTTTLQTYSYLNALGIQPDGKILGAGVTNNGVDYEVALVRYTGAGALDTSFGNSGVITATIGEPSPDFEAVGLQSGGKIIAAGTSVFGTNEKFTLARYTSSGALDTTFDTDGIVTTTIGASAAVCWDMKIQPDNKIVAGGFSDFGGIYVFTAARYTADGALDTAFGTGGVVTSAVSSVYAQGRAVEIQPDGKILLAGYGYVGPSAFIALTRYTTAGALDDTFGISGVVTTTLGTGGSYDAAFTMALQGDGKILVAGQTENASSDYYGMIIRYNSNGTLDSAFGTGGVITATITDFPSINYKAIAVQPNGKIVVAGSAPYMSTIDNIIVARYNANGTIDTGFGANGFILTPLVDWADGSDVKIQADGKILVGGNNYDNPTVNFTVIRYK